MSEPFVAAPERPDGTQTQGIRASGNENFVIYRDLENPSIVIDKKTGNIDIRAEDGTSFLKIDAQNKKLYVGNWDIAGTKEMHRRLLFTLEGLADMSHIRPGTGNTGMWNYEIYSSCIGGFMYGNSILCRTSQRSQPSFAAPERPDGTQTQGIRASGNENFVIYRDLENPSIVIDKKTGNIDIRAEDGTSFLKIDAQNKKLYVGNLDIVDTKEIYQEGSKTLKKLFAGYWDISDTEEIQKEILLRLDELEKLFIDRKCSDAEDWFSHLTNPKPRRRW